MYYKYPIIQPFAALRPTKGFAQEVIAPPYDVLSTSGAYQLATDKPHSFLHISKAEIDLPIETDPHASVVYTKAAENLYSLVKKGVLEREKTPCFYIYRLIIGSHMQTGFAGAASVLAYKVGRILRHELTRIEKENDRARQIKTVQAHTGPVLAIHRMISTLQILVNQLTKNTVPLFSSTSDDQVTHILWKIDNIEDIIAISAIFNTLTLYIADGHHRSAAAEQIATTKKSSDESSIIENNLLLVSFPVNEVMILNYNRVIQDLNGLSCETFLNKLSVLCMLTPVSKKVQQESRGAIGLYLQGKWYNLVWHTALSQEKGLVDQLDSSLLSNHVFKEVLGLRDPREDKRIHYVSGVQGLKILEEYVDSGEMAAAFAMPPLKVGELMTISETGGIMPPKSTWFEPKLADGLLSLLLF